MAKCYFKKYEVEDVVYQETTVLFILESPHTQEIKYGYPVAGNSGLEMTKFIYGDDKDDAFGKIVGQPKKHQKEYNNIKNFGLLNVSPAPMQLGGLKGYDLTVEDKEVGEVLEKLRVNYKTKEHRNQDWNQIKKIILTDFKERLVNQIKSIPQLKYLVPCGKLAATYLDLIKNSNGVIQEKGIISEIPHPSFNQWSRYKTMNKLKIILKEMGIK
ncbi:uracil-DNA glycosylase family protein [Selenihalanaerobacter shriftii]|nr:uracil-DNA glycosylase family protein [Selenihalanaerobacter shriftii]